MSDALPPFDPLTRVDPWAALRDGRMQLLAALDRLREEELDLRVSADGLELRIAEAAALHAAWDRVHRAFFTGLVDGDVRASAEPSVADLEVALTAEALSVDLEDARREVLEAAAGIGGERYEERVASPWDGEVVDSIRGYLVALAMRDGILAEAIVEARRAP